MFIWLFMPKHTLDCIPCISGTMFEDIDVCVCVFSLTKDMTGKEDVYRGPAIRALCRITDVSVHSCFLLVFPQLLVHCLFDSHNLKTVSVTR